VTQIELVAKTFCEASGLYKWEDTRGSVRQWYLTGAVAVLAGLFEDKPKPKLCPHGYSDWDDCPDCCH
jgi:hypothetical protein